MEGHNTVAFIPVRGGSKSIPLKNIKEIGGKPLIYWTAYAASQCEVIDRVYIATDSEKIRAVVESLDIPKVCVIDRSDDTATDKASTESALLEFARLHTFKQVVLIQATSPLLTKDDLDGGFKVFLSPGTDSILSVVRQKRFIWAESAKSVVNPKNYDYTNRPRRQEFAGFLVENGAFYITGRESLLSSKNRISGTIRAYEMHENTYLELDEPDDWIAMNAILSAKNRRLSVPEDIELFVTDCDGVLTDAGMYYTESGDEAKKFHTRDGYAFEMLREAGIKTAIISGEINAILERRAAKVKIDSLIMGTTDKLQALKSLCKKHGIPINKTAYIGDELFDIPAIRECGFGCAPIDACVEAKNAASYVSPVRGGSGVVRDVVEHILTAKQRL